MQAVILAGGKGTRLKPYTTILPKPLMPMGDIPILEVVIRQLKRDGFTEIIMAVGYLGSLIETYFGDGSLWGIQIRYSYEKEPLGTAGPLALIENLVPPFLVMNGDILTNLNYQEFMSHHRKSDSAVTISTNSKAVEISLGIIETDTNQDISNYVEKPTLNYQVSMGIYGFSERAVQYIKQGEYLDFPTLIKKLLSNKERVKSYPFKGIWLDIGRKEDYENAVEMFEEVRNEFLPESD